MKVVIPVGPPWSGKSFVADILGRCCGGGGFHFSTKAVLEEHGNREALACIRRGGVVADDVMIPLFEKYLPTTKRVVIIDSIRSVEQFHWLRSERPHDELYTLHLTIAPEAIWRRREEKIKQKNHDRGPRVDDGEEILKGRLQEYDRYATLLLPVLRAFTHLEEVNAGASMETVAAEILAFGRRCIVPNATTQYRASEQLVEV